MIANTLLSSPLCSWAAVLTLFTGSGTLLGFAASDQGPSSEVSFDGPRIGDQGRYMLRILENQDGEVRQIFGPQPLVDFEVLENRSLVDKDGRKILANQFSYTFYRFNAPDQWGPHLRYHLYFEAGTSTLSAYSRESLSNQSQSDPLGTQTDTLDVRSISLLDQSSVVLKLLCGLRHSAQGRSVDASGSVQLASSCRLTDFHEKLDGLPTSLLYVATLGFAEPIPPNEIRLVGMDTIADRSVALFDVVDGHVGEALLWIDPETGYPLQYLLEEQRSGGSRFNLITLETLRRGEAPITDTVENTQAAAPELEYTERHPWGPSEAGIHHAFPLSSALGVALAADPDNGLAPFLEEHPDAIMWQASYEETEHDGVLNRTWLFSFSDGLGDRHVGVSQIRGVAARQSSPLGGLPPIGVVDEQLNETRTVFDNGSAALHGDGPGYLRDQSPPDSWPTLTSLGSRWAFFAREEHSSLGLNSWGFKISCSAYVVKDHGCLESLPCTGDACPPGMGEARQAPLEVRFVVGHERSFRESRDRLAPTLEHVVSLLHVDHQGHASQLDERNEQRSYALAPGAALISQPDSAKAVAATARKAPRPIEAASLVAGGSALGLLAIALGWYLLKNGIGLGLFSRVEKPHALRHESRQMLMGLIDADPGIHLQELIRRSGLAGGVARHHLTTLTRTGLVVVARSPGFVCYFPAGRVDRRQMRVTPFLKSPGSQAIVHTLKERPGVGLTQLARHLDLRKQTVAYHLARLEAAKLVRIERDAAEVRIFLTDDAMVAAT